MHVMQYLLAIATFLPHADTRAVHNTFDFYGLELMTACLWLQIDNVVFWQGVAINFVKSDDIRILRDIEQYYSTQVDEMVSCSLVDAPERYVACFVQTDIVSTGLTFLFCCSQ